MTGLRILTAYPAEASPFIKCYGLTKQQSRSQFEIFSHHKNALIISGPGKSAAATATTTLHKECDSQMNAIWVNIGVAGHANRPLGEVVLVDHISSASSNDSWDIRHDIKHHFPTCKLITVDSPVTDYEPNTLYDMEASGFYSTALDYTDYNRVHCIKVVSDNQKFPLHTLSLKKAKILMQQSQQQVSEYLDYLVKCYIHS